jgi:uncharacterized membrane protein YhaH (DUF805 family)
MGFGEAIKTVFGKYADFSGRARRSEYWYWILLAVIVAIVIAVLRAISNALGLVVDVLWVLGTIVPGLAVLFRRLHDTGRSGWWWLIGLIPIVGWIVLIVFTCQDSQPGENQHGPNPKGSMGQQPADPPYPQIP